MDTSKPVTPEAVIAAHPGDLSTMSTHHVLALYRRWQRIDARFAYERGEYGSVEDYRKAGADAISKAIPILKAELDRRPNVEYGRKASQNRRKAAQRGV